MTEAEQRAAVVAEARTWLGTPYHEQADVKGAGLDCGMSLVRWFVDSGIVPPFDPRPYSDNFFLHRGDTDEEPYLDIIRKCGGVEVTRSPLPGDVAAWRIGFKYAHGALVIEWPIVIHAYKAAGLVVYQDVSQLPLNAKKHPMKLFSRWG